ncbi:MAG TPA: nucleotidyltransferase family protein [Anaerolineae bacterium]|nr:nucleotidyltransferase family protein [Anaerolineae bacterium]
MKALVLAAGKDTRLGPLTNHVPKAMLPVGGRPLLEHIIELLRRHGITEIAVNLHHKPDAILRHFGSGEAWGVHLRYSYEASLLGSAGTALRHLAWIYPDPFLVYYGDVYSDMNLTELIEHHRAGQAAATMAVTRVDDPTHRGIVEFDADQRVRRFVEKPPADQVFSRWSNSGICVLNPEVLHFVSDIPSDFGQDVFPRLLEAGVHIQAYPITGTLIDIGTPENLQRAQQAAAGLTQPQPAGVGRVGIPSATA